MRPVYAWWRWWLRRIDYALVLAIIRDPGFSPGIRATAVELERVLMAAAARDRYARRRRAS